MSSTSPWWLYILKTNQQTLYTGITTDVNRRLREHAQGQGAKYLRRFNQLEIMYQCEVADRSTASRLEVFIKQCSKQQKLEIIDKQLSVTELQDYLNKA